MKKSEMTIQKLLKAFDESETKEISDVCRIAEVSRVTFYNYFNKVPTFRRDILGKRRKNLDLQIISVAA